MATYYVSNSGNDGNAGTTSGSPWKTISKINSSSFVPGDIIQFNGGQTFIGTLIPPSGGTSASPITFQSYGTENAIISATAADGIDITNLSGIAIRNLTLTGDGTNGVGIYASAQASGNVKYTEGLTFNNIIISGFDTGISIGGDASDSSASGFTNVSVNNSTIHDCINHGFISYGSAYGIAKSHTNITVVGNSVYNIVGVSGTANASGNGIVFGETDSGIIRGNLIHDCGANNTSLSGPVGAWCYDSNAIVIQFNEVYNQKTNSGTDGGGFDIDGGSTNCIMEYNYSHDNYGPGFMFYAYNDGYVGIWDSNTCRYNISQNDATQNTGNYMALLISANSTITNAYMYNNTVFNNVSGCTVLGLTGSSIESATGIISNNILQAGSGVTLVATDSSNPTSLIITGNNYYNTGTFAVKWNGITYTTFASWQTATGLEKISGINVAKTVDPLLISPGTTGVVNYQIQNSSPLSANGLNLSVLYSLSIGAQDYFGSAVPNSGGNYSVGAHQPMRFTGRIFF